MGFSLVSLHGSILAARARAANELVERRDSERNTKRDIGKTSWTKPVCLKHQRYRATGGRTRGTEPVGSRRKEQERQDGGRSAEMLGKLVGYLAAFALTSVRSGQAVPEAWHGISGWEAEESSVDEFDPRLPVTEASFHRGQLAAGEEPTVRRIMQSEDTCDSLIDANTKFNFDNLIATNTVMVFGVAGARCTIEGEAALQDRAVCYVFHALNTAEWDYFKCKWPDERVGNTPMHSYFYFGGQFQGNGFKLQPGRVTGSFTAAEVDANLAAVSADTSCRMDLTPSQHPKLAMCQSQLANSMLTLDQINAKLATNKVVLLGWSRCPCTGIASARFEDDGVCFDKTVWDSSEEKLMGFLGCLYGPQHHSFIFIGDRFIDNGFRFARPPDNPSISESDLTDLYVGASADLTCGPEGEPFFQDFTHLLTHNPAQKNYGVSVTDIDGDGTFEMVVAGYGVANLALKYNPSSGQFDDIALDHSALQDTSRQAIGVAACDIDGDGYEELYILNTDQYSGDTSTSDRLMERSQAGAYRDMFEMPRHAGASNFIAGRSCACTDRDGDGKYGVIVSNYGMPGDTAPMKLYELNSDGDLTDVAPALGIARTTGGRALISAPIRSSNRMDIFANNENGCNWFYRNTGDGYVEEAGALGIADCNNNGRGTATVDGDKDGLLDIVYGNWNGQHKLYIQEPSNFVDQATAGMAEPSRIRTVIAADFDNDGEEELFYNNIPGANRLFRRSGTTWEQTNIGDAIESSMHGTGAAVGDFDGDGMLELLISHGESASETLTYYRARSGSDNHWLRILPLTQHGAPARGAVVRMTMAAAIGTAGERVHIRAIDAGSGYLCQMEPVAHFGLGVAPTVFEVKVSWPDGSELLLSNPSVDRMYRIAHPATGGTSGEHTINHAIASPPPQLVPSRYASTPCVS